MASKTVFGILFDVNVSKDFMCFLCKRCRCYVWPFWKQYKTNFFWALPTNCLSMIKVFSGHYQHQHILKSTRYACRYVIRVNGASNEFSSSAGPKTSLTKSWRASAFVATKSKSWGQNKKSPLNLNCILSSSSPSEISVAFQRKYEKKYYKHLLTAAEWLLTMACNFSDWLGKWKLSRRAASNCNATTRTYSGRLEKRTRKAAMVLVRNSLGSIRLQ